MRAVDAQTDARERGGAVVGDREGLRQRAAHTHTAIADRTEAIRQRRDALRHGDLRRRECGCAHGKDRIRRGLRLMADDALRIAWRSGGRIQSKLHDQRGECIIVLRRRSPIRSRRGGWEEQTMRWRLDVRETGESGHRVIHQRLHFLHIRHAPVTVTRIRESFDLCQSSRPCRRRARHLLPHQTRVEVSDGAVVVAHIVVAVRLLGAAHIAGVIAQGAAHADGFRLRLWPQTTAFIRAPHIRRARAIEITAPPISRPCHGIVWKEGRVQGRVRYLMIEQAEQLMRCRQPPIIVAARGHARSIGDCVFPSGLAIVHALPHQAGDVVGDGAVTVIGENLGIDRVVAVLAITCRTGEIARL